jgi:WD40 repeat protein
VRTFSLTKPLEEPVETRGDVVLRTERTRHAAGLDSFEQHGERQTLRGNVVRFAVERVEQRAADDSPVLAYGYEQRHKFVHKGLWSFEVARVWEGPAAEEVMKSQPHFEIEIKFRCGGRPTEVRLARYLADSMRMKVADLIRHTTAPAPPPRATNRPVQNAQNLLELPDDLIRHIVEMMPNAGDVAAVAPACKKLRDIAVGPSAFLLYLQAEREKVKQENPSASLGEVSKILGEKWKVPFRSGRSVPFEWKWKVSNERRANYQAKAVELKARSVVAAKRRVSLEGHTGAVTCIAMTTDARIITGSSDKTVKVWAPTGGACLCHIGGHDDIVYGVAHVMPPPPPQQQQPPPPPPPQPPPNTFAAAANAAAAAPPPPPMGGGRVLSVSASPTGGALKLWNLAKEGDLNEVNRKTYFSAVCVAAMPDGQQVVLGCSSGAVLLFNINTGTVVHEFHRWYGPANYGPYDNLYEEDDNGGHRGEVRAVTVTPDGQHIISCSDDSYASSVRVIKVWGDRARDERCGTVKVWSAIHHTLRSTSDEHLVLSVAAMPDSPRYLSGGRDGIVRVWGLHDGNLQNTFLELHRWYTRKMCEVGDNFYEVSALVALPDSRRALAGWSSGAITLFDVSNGDILGTFRPHTECVRCLAVTPDGHHFGSGSDDKTVRIVEIPSEDEE